MQSGGEGFPGHSRLRDLAAQIFEKSLAGAKAFHGSDLYNRLLFRSAGAFNYRMVVT